MRTYDDPLEKVKDDWIRQRYGESQIPKLPKEFYYSPGKPAVAYEFIKRRTLRTQDWNYKFTLFDLRELIERVDHYIGDNEYVGFQDTLMALVAAGIEVKRGGKRKGDWLMKLELTFDLKDTVKIFAPEIYQRQTEVHEYRDIGSLFGGKVKPAVNENPRDEDTLPPIN